MQEDLRESHIRLERPPVLLTSPKLAGIGSACLCCVYLKTLLTFLEQGLLLEIPQSGGGKHRVLIVTYDNGRPKIIATVELRLRYLHRWHMILRSTLVGHSSNDDNDNNDAC